jgi:hypothetical protein
MTTSNQMPASEIRPATARVLMFDVSLPWAEFWYDAFNVILFVGAFAVAVGTYGSIKMGAVKERFGDERISTNEKETKRAVADSDIAKAEAAKANEAAASANVEIALAREQTAKAQADLEIAKSEARQIDANLLREQRLTAQERWRLRHLERAVLPRSQFVDWARLEEALKGGGGQPFNIAVL